MNCLTAKSLLSDYIDDTLSARMTWELDKHLSECNDCTRLLNETRRTVSLLADAPRFEVSNDFVANLQARLAHVEQEPAGPTWMDSLRELFRPRVRPILGAALATCALAAIVILQYVPQNPQATASQPTADSRLVQSARTQSIALVATDPFGDTAAASVAANTAAYSTRSASPESGSTEAVY